MKDDSESLSLKLNRVREEASEWVTRHDLGLTAEQQDEFFDWLADDPLHSEYFEKQLSIWNEFDLMEQWKPSHSDEPNPDLLATPIKRIAGWQRWSWIGGIAAVLMLSLVWWQFAPTKTIENIPSTLAIGEAASGFERHVLDDGSEVELNEGAQASVAYSEKGREIQLQCGEAFFSVAKDKTRPFVVYADGMEIKALGTAFSVEIKQGTVEVIVTEGRVWFDQSKDVIEHESELNGGSLVGTEIFAGQRSIASSETVGVSLRTEEISRKEILEEHAWKDELLQFSGAPLERVLEEFNRRNAVQLRIADLGLRDRRITAALRPTNVSGFLEMLKLALGIEAEYGSEYEVLLRKAE